MKEFLIENWIALSSTVGTIIVYISSRATRKEDLKERKATAVEAMQQAYDKFVEDSNKQYDLLISKIKDLEEKERTALTQRAILLNDMERLKKEHIEDKEKIASLQRKIEEYELKITHYEEEVTRLQKELSTYKNANK